VNAEGDSTEVRIGMHTSTLWRRPARRMHSRRFPARLTTLLLFHKQRDRILSPDLTAQIFSRPSRTISYHLKRLICRHHRLTNINMMQIQIIRDITLLPLPRLERLPLRFWLAHLTMKVIELTARLRSCSSICVGRIETLVVFDKDEDFDLSRFVEKGLVLG